MNPQDVDERKHVAGSDIVDHQNQESHKQRDCPGKEELADMAAGLCSSEQRENIKQHFTTCKTCYEEWMALCFEMAAMGRGSVQKTSLRTFTRILGCLGLVGVVLACVVFFFTIAP